MKKSIVSLALLSVVTGASFAQVTKVGDKYDFKLKFSKGKVIQHELISSINMGATAQPMSFNMTVKMTIVSVNGDKATAKVELIGGPQGNQPAETFTIDTRGRVSGAPNQVAQNIQIPTKPIKIGESFEIPLNMGGQMPMRGNVRLTFQGVKTIGGKQVAVMSSSLQGSGQMAMTGKGNTYISMADGFADSSTMKMTMNMSMPGQGGKAGQKQSIDMNMNLKRK